MASLIRASSSSVLVSLVMDVNNFRAGLRTSLSEATSWKQAMQQTGQQAFVAIQSAAMNAGVELVAFGAATAKVTKLFADFENASVQAAAAGTNLRNGLNATAADMAKFNDEVQQNAKDFRDFATAMSEKFPVASQDIVEGFLEIAKAGVEAQDAIGGMQGVIELAASSGASMANVGEVVAQVGMQFDISFSRAKDITDSFIQSIAESPQSFEKMREGFKAVGSVASEFGISLQETEAFLNIMAKVGQQGSVAGTGLRNLLTTLSEGSAKTVKVLKEVGLSVQDVDPEIVGLSASIQRLGASGISTGQIFEIFGKRTGTTVVNAVRAAQRAAKEGTTALEENIRSVQQKSPIAIVESQTKTFFALVETTKNKVLNSLRSVGEAIAPVMSVILKAVSEIAAGFRGFAESGFGKLTLALGAGYLVFRNFVNLIKVGIGLTVKMMESSVAQKTVWASINELTAKGNVLAQERIASLKAQAQYVLTGVKTEELTLSLKRQETAELERQVGLQKELQGEETAELATAKSRTAELEKQAAIAKGTGVPSLGVFPQPVDQRAIPGGVVPDVRRTQEAASLEILNKLITTQLNAQVALSKELETLEASRSNVTSKNVLLAEKEKELRLISTELTNRIAAAELKLSVARKALVDDEFKNSKFREETVAQVVALNKELETLQVEQANVAKSINGIETAQIKNLEIEAALEKEILNFKLGQEASAARLTDLTLTRDSLISREAAGGVRQKLDLSAVTAETEMQAAQTKARQADVLVLKEQQLELIRKNVILTEVAVLEGKATQTELERARYILASSEALQLNTLSQLENNAAVTASIAGLKASNVEIKVSETGRASLIRLDKERAAATEAAAVSEAANAKRLAGLSNVIKLGASLAAFEFVTQYGKMVSDTANQNEELIKNVQDTQNKIADIFGKEGTVDSFKNKIGVGTGLDETFIKNVSNITQSIEQSKNATKEWLDKIAELKEQSLQVPLEELKAGTIGISEAMAQGVGFVDAITASFGKLNVAVQLGLPLLNAVAGFFIGGPWGAAIGAAIGAVEALGVSLGVELPKSTQSGVQQMKESLSDGIARLSGEIDKETARRNFQETLKGIFGANSLDEVFGAVKAKVRDALTPKELAAPGGGILNQQLNELKNIDLQLKTVSQSSEEYGKLLAQQYDLETKITAEKAKQSFTITESVAKDEVALEEKRLNSKKSLRLKYENEITKLTEEQRQLRLQAENDSFDLEQRVKAAADAESKQQYIDAAQAELATIKQAATDQEAIVANSKLKLQEIQKNHIDFTNEIDKKAAADQKENLTRTIDSLTDAFKERQSLQEEFFNGPKIDAARKSAIDGLNTFNQANMILMKNFNGDLVRAMEEDKAFALSYRSLRKEMIAANKEFITENERTASELEKIQDKANQLQLTVQKKTEDMFQSLQKIDTDEKKNLENRQSVYNDKIADLNQNLADKLADIALTKSKTLQTIEASLAKSLLDISGDYADRKEDLDRKLADQLADIERTKNDAIASAQRSAQDARAKENEAYNDRIKENNKKHTEDLVALEKEKNEKVKGANDNFSSGLSSLADKATEVTRAIREQTNALKDLNKEFDEKKVKAALDLEKDKAKIHQDALDKIKKSETDSNEAIKKLQEKQRDSIKKVNDDIAKSYVDLKKSFQDSIKSSNDSLVKSIEDVKRKLIADIQEVNNEIANINDPAGEAARRRIQELETSFSALSDLYAKQNESAGSLADAEITRLQLVKLSQKIFEEQQQSGLDDIQILDERIKLQQRLNELSVPGGPELGGGLDEIAKLQETRLNVVLGSNTIEEIERKKLEDKKIELQKEANKAVIKLQEDHQRELVALQTKYQQDLQNLQSANAQKLADEQLRIERESADEELAIRQQLADDKRAILDQENEDRKAADQKYLNETLPQMEEEFNKKREEIFKKTGESFTKATEDITKVQIKSITDFNAYLATITGDASASLTELLSGATAAQQATINAALSSLDGLKAGFQNASSEITSKLSEDLAKVETDYAEKKSSIDKKFADDALNIQQDHTRKLADINTSLSNAVSDAQKHATEALADAQKNYSQSIAELNADIERRKQEAAKNAEEARAKANQDYIDALAKTERDIAEGKAVALRELDEAILGIQASAVEKRKALSDDYAQFQRQLIEDVTTFARESEEGLRTAGYTLSEGTKQNVAAIIEGMKSGKTTVADLTNLTNAFAGVAATQLASIKRDNGELLEQSKNVLKIKENLTEVNLDLNKSIQDVGKALPGVSKEIGKVADSVQGAAKDIKDAGKDAGKGMSANFKAAISDKSTGIPSSVKVVTDVQPAFKAAAVPLGKVTADGYVQGIKDGFQNISSPISDVIKRAIENIKSAIANTLNGLSSAVSSALGSVFTTFKTKIIDFIRQLDSLIQTLVSKINRVKDLTRSGGSSSSGSGNVVPHAKGGIVKGPQVALIGEDGPEAVVPLDPTKFESFNKRTGFMDIMAKLVPMGRKAATGILSSGGNPTVTHTTQDTSSNTVNELATKAAQAAYAVLQSLGGKTSNLSPADVANIIQASVPDFSAYREDIKQLIPNLVNEAVHGSNVSANLFQAAKAIGQGDSFKNLASLTEILTDISNKAGVQADAIIAQTNAAATAAAEQQRLQEEAAAQAKADAEAKAAEEARYQAEQLDIQTKFYTLLESAQRNFSGTLSESGVSDLKNQITAIQTVISRSGDQFGISSAKETLKNLSRGMEDLSGELKSSVSDYLQEIQDLAADGFQQSDITDATSIIKDLERLQKDAEIQQTRAYTDTVRSLEDISDQIKASKADRALLDSLGPGVTLPNFDTTLPNLDTGVPNVDFTGGGGGGGNGLSEATVQQLMNVMSRFIDEEQINTQRIVYAIGEQSDQEIRELVQVRQAIQYGRQQESAELTLLNANLRGKQI